jgi:hypothetical protein
MNCLEGKLEAMSGNQLESKLTIQLLPDGSSWIPTIGWTATHAGIRKGEVRISVHHHTCYGGNGDSDITRGK